MKILFRNFWFTIRRYKLASALNILGLSLAFAAFAVIMMQVRYDTGFDKFHSNSGRIFRVERFGENQGPVAIMSRLHANLFLEAAPQIELGALTDSRRSGGEYVTVERNGSKTGFQEGIWTVYPDFTQIFDFDLVEGSLGEFGKPDVVLIPQEMATRFYGEQSALGQQITRGQLVLTVGGVYRDFPENTLLQNAIFASTDPDKVSPDESWWNQGFNLFVVLNSAEGREAAAAAMENRINAMHKQNGFDFEERVRLTPIEDIYYDRNIEFDNSPKGNRAVTWLLFSIALLVIVVAAINFVNFATSLAPMRLKSINTQKVLGSPTSTLRTALVGESLAISLVAFGLAVGWIVLLGATGFIAYFTADISLTANLSIIGITFGCAIAMGLLAGLYPAWYTTSFPPALVLKGSFGMSPQGKKLRTALVGFQFVVSTALIIAALFMQLQNNFMRRMDTGIDTERLAIAEIDPMMGESARRVLAERLKQSPLVAEVGFLQEDLGTSDIGSEWGFRMASDSTRGFHVQPVSWNVPQMLDARIVEGRSFTETDALKSHTSLIINQTAARQYGIGVGYIFQEGEEVIGIVKDFNYRTLRSEIGPMAFVVTGEGGPNWFRKMFVRIQGDPVAAVTHIRNTVASVDPAYPVAVEFFDTTFDHIYQKERKTTVLVTIFSLLAVVISLVGVFGLVVFETQYRRKEIGVRKVFGASIGEVLMMFNRFFTRIVLVCFVLAAPLAWYGVSGWLRNFPYRTPLHWWIFVLSLAIVLLITLLTVTLQSWRAATANPVESLRAE